MLLDNSEQTNSRVRQRAIVFTILNLFNSSLIEPVNPPITLSLSLKALTRFCVFFNTTIYVK